MEEGWDERGKGGGMGGVRVQGGMGMLREGKRVDKLRHP